MEEDVNFGGGEVGGGSRLGEGRRNGEELSKFFLDQKAHSLGLEEVVVEGSAGERTWAK